MKLNNKGFTLIEVLVVVVIIAIIGGVAVSGVLATINRGKNASYYLMINDIVTASQILYDEVNFGNDVYEYNNNGSTSTKVSISSNKIETSLQTLVSNGFLTGTENTVDSCDDDSNCNKRLIRDPRSGEDISDCRINIVKNSGKYMVTNASSGTSKCPVSYVERLDE